MVERRSNTRYELQVTSKISYVSDGSSIGQDVVSKDVSSTGAFFMTETPPPAGTNIRIEIVLPISRIKPNCPSDSRMHCEGKIVRREIDGIAVQFTTPCEIIPQNPSSLSLS